MKLSTTKDFFANPFVVVIITLLIASLSTYGVVNVRASRFILLVIFALGVLTVLSLLPETHSKKRKVLVTIASGVVLAVSLIALDRWAVKHGPETTAEKPMIEKGQDEPQSPLPSTPLLPIPSSAPAPVRQPIDPALVPVVRIRIGSFGQVQVKNVGPVDVSDFGYMWGTFYLDRASYINKQVVIGNASTTSPLAVGSATIRSGRELNLDLKKNLEFSNFNDVIAAKGQIIDAQLEYYGLRFTFRDSRTGQKFACYKVVSSVGGMPSSWADYVGVGGTPQHTTESDIPGVIIETMKDKYADGATDGKCER